MAMPARSCPRTTSAAQPHVADVLDRDEAREFLRHHHHAVLATMRRDGTPQMSPVGVGVDDTGRAIISSRETAVKTKNVRRDPRAWVCVFPDSFYGDRFVQVEGTVTVV